MGPRLIAALVAVFWVVVVGGVAGPASGRLASVVENDQASFLPDGAESTQALALEAGFRSSDVVPTLVVYEREGGTTAADLARAQDDVARIADLDGLLADPSPPQPSRDGEALQVFVPLDGTDQDAIIPTVEELRDLLDRDGAPGGLDVHVTGVGGLTADLFAVFETIDSTLLVATAGVVVLILLLVYRSPVLWVLPLVAAGLAFVLAGAAVYGLVRAGVLRVDGQGQGILTVLVFGAGTDYALLLIARYREELHAHERPWDAMRVALRGAVPAIVASAATVVLGLLCLLFSDLGSNRDLGPVSAVGIVAALLAMTTFLPALLVLAGRRVFWPRIPRHDGLHTDDAGVWDRVAGLVGRRSRAVAGVTTGLLVLLCLGALQLQASGIPQSEAITGDADSVVGQRVLGEHFPAGAGTPVTVVGPADRADDLLAAVQRTPGVAVAALYADPPPGAPVAAPGTPPEVVDGRVLVDVLLSVPGEGARGAAAVNALRDAVDGVDASAVVGGFPAIDVDVQEASQRDRVVIIPVILLVILLVLGLLLRSIVAPLLLVATVVLSFVATLGACALVFRYVFGFPGADSSFPLFAFVFLVALGIDYNIFLMTRVREETVALGTRRGTLKGLAVTGGVITSAGVVLAATFAVLGVLPLVFLAELGFAVAFGVLLDTLVVRSLLVPALTLELGDRVWWPSALGRGAAPGRPAPLPPGRVTARADPRTTHSG